MIKRDYRKLIQKNREHCINCALVKEFCICGHVPSIESDIIFILLSHTNELKKRTNTGILIEKSMTSTLVIEWQRKEPSKELLDIINMEKEVYFLYTETNETNEIVTLDASEEKIDAVCSKKYIIILDGTWQEAKKIYNRSEYLKDLKRISITPENLSEYQLRRKKNEQHLCTAEAAIITLKKFGEDKNSDILKDYFEKFQVNYKYSQSN